jgi:hypothetical protein
MILEIIYMSAAKKIAAHVKKSCVYSNPPPANIGFVNGRIRKKRKGHKNTNPDNIFPA